MPPENWGMRSTRHWLPGVLAALAAAAIPAAAQEWPARDLTLVVPFAAGGDDDILARILAPRLAQYLGEPVNVENVPGSGGMTLRIR